MGGRDPAGEGVPLASKKDSQRPATLARGDLVGIVAPGFAVRRKALEAGVTRLENAGYRVRLGSNVLAREGYLAGNDEARAADLNAMIGDPEVRAIWFARGGYGTSRILDRVAWRKLGSRPRLLVGYSDLTALFAAAVDRAGTRCLYGPVITELGEDSSYHRPSLREALAGEPVTWRFRKRDIQAPGSARGRLVGGNLSVLGHSMGTRFAPKTEGSILFLEDVGEQIYRIDRTLTQLRIGGFFRKLQGVVLGHFEMPARRRFPPDRPWQEVLRENFATLGVPVVSGLPAGHRPGKWTLPLGGMASLDTTARQLRIEP
jgi:muramoyltetrapeptide carboxypeptidase